jgi:chromosome segregation ATPase
MQRSIYSSGYLSNGNLGRSYTSEVHSPTRSQGVGYSSSFLKELEKHHDRSLQIANDRMKSQEIQHERNIESLKSQINGLKQQLENNDKAFQREEARLEEDYNYRLNMISRESDIKLRPIIAQINEYEKDIERTSLSYNSEFREISKAIHDLKSENSNLRPKIEVLNSELEKLNVKFYEDSQQELNLLDKEKKNLTRSHQSELEILTESHRRNINNLHQTISAREEKIEALQNQLNVQKKSLNDLIYNSNEEIRRLEDSLQSARNLLNKQERDINQIQSVLSEAKKETRVLQNERISMESDINTTKKENEYLKQEIKRLEKLVYGRGSPKRS